MARRNPNAQPEHRLMQFKCSNMPHQDNGLCYVLSLVAGIPRKDAALLCESAATGGQFYAFASEVWPCY